MNAPTPNEAWRRPVPPNGDPPASGPAPDAGEPLIYFGDTDVGRRRSINQDNFVVGDVELPSGHAVLLAVADGMGGAAGGEVASGHAVEELRRVLQDPPAGRSEGDLLAEGIIAANRAIFEHGQADPSLQGMGTTMVMVLVRGRQAVAGHVGDSRALLIRGGLVHRLTADHSWVAEQVRRGEITEEEAEQSNFRNVLTRSVGVAGSVTPEVSPPFELFPGDVLLLCSDGLHGTVPETVIAQVATSQEPRAAVAQLIHLANEAGGPDNITVVIGRVSGAAPAMVLPPPSPASTVAQTERIPASAVPPPPAAAPIDAAPGGLPPAPPAGALASPPLAAPPSPAAPPARGRGRLPWLLGAVAAALAIVGGGLFATTRGKSDKPSNGNQASATITPSAAPATSQPSASSTAGGTAGGGATTATAPPSTRTPTPTATQGAEIGQTAPAGSARPLFLSQPIAALTECQKNTGDTAAGREPSVIPAPCKFTVPVGDGIVWNASEVQSEFGITPLCLRRANQEYNPGEPLLEPLDPSRPDDLNIRLGIAYRLVAPAQCNQLPPLPASPVPATATSAAGTATSTPLRPPLTLTPPVPVPTVPGR